VKHGPATPESFALPGCNDRHRFFIDPLTGKLFPLVQGGEGEGAAPAAATAADLAALQAQIDAAKNSAVTDAQKAAYLDVLAKLGVTDLDQAADAIKAKQTADAASLSDLQKAQAEVDRLKAELDAAKADTAKAAADVNQLALRVLVDDALKTAGCPKDATADVRPMVQVEDGSDLAKITAAVEALKAKLPGVFTAKADDGKGGNFDTGGAPNGDQAAKTAMQKGREESQALKAAQTKPATGVLAGLAPTA